MSPQATPGLPDPFLSMGKLKEAARARVGASPSLSGKEGAGRGCGGRDSAGRPQKIPGDVQEADPPSYCFGEDIQPNPTHTPNSRTG